MLCPEVWNFNVPEYWAETFQGEFKNKNITNNEIKTWDKIKSVNFNHMVTVIIPTELNPTTLDLTNDLREDCEYYKVSDIKCSEFVETTFLKTFIHCGELIVLSVDRRIDTDDCFCITTSGYLILSLTKASYQSLGIEGRVSAYHTDTKSRYFYFSLQYNMPRYRSVPPLQRLGLAAVGDLVVALAPSILAQIDPHREPQQSLQRALDQVQALLVSHVPIYLYDDMADYVLQAVKGLIDRTKKGYYPQISMSAFMTQMNVVVSLTETVLSEHLRAIDFSRWPKIMRYVLYKCLHKMSGVEVLNLGSCTGGWRTEEYDKSLITGISNMRHLRSLCLCFDCTDHIIQIISDTCTNLHTLDITSSRSVTDRSVPSLLRCLRLRELLLLRTSISPHGLAQLLVGLPELRDIGRCDDFGHVLEFIQEFGGSQLNLRRLHMKDLSTENLSLLVRMCPKIENVSLFRDELFSDLTVLTHLENLSDLKILSCEFYTSCMKQFLEVRGYNLTSLHLEHVEEIDGRALIYVSRSCPFLKSLIFYNCDFLEQNSSAFYEDYSFHPKDKPFQHLERIFWVVDCALVHLEFILANATSIKSIHLGSSTGITHASIEKTIKVNPMGCLQELRILYSMDLSIETVRLFLESCPTLRVMSELESWSGITWEELVTFRDYISSNNFDLDIRPTLSY